MSSLVQPNPMPPQQNSLSKTVGGKRRKQSKRLQDGGKKRKQSRKRRNKSRRRA